MARMRLLDQIAQTTSAVHLSDADGTIVALPGAETMAPLLRRCPLRYVLSDGATSFAAQTAFEPPSLLDDCLDIVRAPASCVWVEYDQKARHSVFSALRLGPDIEPRSQRVGLLARMQDETLRRGQITIAWEARDGAPPELSPIVAQFDLDRPRFAGAAALPALACRSPELSVRGLLDRVRLCLHPQWRDYYRRRFTNPRQFDAALLRNAEFAFGDLPMLFAVFLLTMSKGALLLRESELEHLNRSRLKRGKADLLDHVEVRINLLTDEADRRGGGDGQVRQGPRLHHVRGHLVRRGKSLFWRSPHLRGDPHKGEVLRRTVTLETRQSRRG